MSPCPFSTTITITPWAPPENDGNTNYNWFSWYSKQRIDTETGGLGNKKTSRDHPNYRIKIDQNTEKSSGDLRGFAVTTVRNHRLTLV